MPDHCLSGVVLSPCMRIDHAMAARSQFSNGARTRIPRCLRQYLLFDTRTAAIAIACEIRLCECRSFPKEHPRELRLMASIASQTGCVVRSSSGRKHVDSCVIAAPPARCTSRRVMRCQGSSRTDRLTQCVLALLRKLLHGLAGLRPGFRELRFKTRTLHTNIHYTAFHPVCAYMHVYMYVCASVAQRVLRHPRLREVVLAGSPWNFLGITRPARAGSDAIGVYTVAALTNSNEACLLARTPRR